MKAYTRNELAEDLAKETGAPVSDMKAIVTFIVERLTSVLAEGRKIEFRDFGVFTPRIRKQKVGRNPRYPEKGSFTIPQRWMVRFKMGRELDQKLRKNGNQI